MHVTSYSDYWTSFCEPLSLPCHTSLKKCLAQWLWHWRDWVPDIFRPLPGCVCLPFYFSCELLAIVLSVFHLLYDLSSSVFYFFIVKLLLVYTYLPPPHPPPNRQCLSDLDQYQAHSDLGLQSTRIGWACKVPIYLNELLDFNSPSAV